MTVRVFGHVFCMYFRIFERKLLMMLTSQICHLACTSHFDETRTAQVKKQMDLTICYWSPTHNKVIVTFYTLFFGHAEAGKV